MKKIIMIVDDEPHIADLVKVILRSEGFKVVTANSGKDALKKLGRVSPDLILLDLMMPGMTGIETLEKIRQNPRLKDTKVAFLTVVKLSEIKKKKDLKDLKITDYIEKPFDNTELAEKVKKLVQV